MSNSERETDFKYESRQEGMKELRHRERKKSDQNYNTVKLKKIGFGSIMQRLLYDSA